MADKEELLDPTSSEVQKKIEEIKKKSQKTPSSLKAQLATREKLERDYLEDIIQVTFESSPGVNRMVESRRPNNEEYIELLKLGMQLTRLSSTIDDSGIEELSNIMRRLGTIAATLTIDSKLDEEFWNKKVSSIALQNFINGLMTASQTGFGITESEFKSFR